MRVGEPGTTARHLPTWTTYLLRIGGGDGPREAQVNARVYEGAALEHEQHSGFPRPREDICHGLHRMTVSVS